MIGSDNAGSQRPYERVLAYLERELELSTLAPGSRLPTTRQISDKLKVSSGTVRNAFRRLASEGRVHMAVGNGTFWLGTRQGKRQFVFGVNRKELPRADGWSSWSFQVFGGLLQGSLGRGLSVNFVPVEIDGRAKMDERLRSLDGMVLLPSENQQSLAGELDQLGLPHICLNPPECMATANFVSPDYFTASLRLGQAWRRTGRRKVLLFLCPDPETSVSCRQRQAGLLSGLADGGGTAPAFEMLFGSDDDAWDLRQALISRIRESGVPDAIYCAGDQMAVDVLRVATSLGIAVPEQMSVVGGNGLLAGPSAQPRVTATFQPLARVGERILEMLLQRVEDPSLCLPGIYEPMEFAIGATTRESENEFLQTKDKTTT